jgi:hypothetical protein
MCHVHWGNPGIWLRASSTNAASKPCFCFRLNFYAVINLVRVVLMLKYYKVRAS